MSNQPSRSSSARLQTIHTCEELASGRDSPKALSGGAFELLQDPFGLRKAIVPVFWLRPDGSLQGLGTAFALDPWGTLASADHVISDFRLNREYERRRYPSAPTDDAIVVLLGMGLVLGQVGVPPKFMPPVQGLRGISVPADDPIAELQGRTASKPLDLSLLSIGLGNSGDMVHTLPLKAVPPVPAVGEHVTAIGFAQIDTFQGDAPAATRISEGLYVARGRVTQILPTGRDSANPTPVFEVEGHWPSGMSGGPVFNHAGEVIGIVSRSYVSDDQREGRGWATLLRAFNLSKLVPSLSSSNPTWRHGWGLMSRSPRRLVDIFPSEDQAIAASKAHASCDVAWVEWRIGSDDFMEETL